MAIIYFLTNVAYLAVLTPQEIFASKAIAVVSTGNIAEIRVRAFWVGVFI